MNRSVSDTAFSRLQMMKRIVLYQMGREDLREPSQKIISMLVKKHIDPSIGRRTRNQFLSWLYERKIKTSVFEDEGGITPCEAKGLLRLFSVTKYTLHDGSFEWDFYNPGQSGKDLEFIQEAFARVNTVCSCCGWRVYVESDGTCPDCKRRMTWQFSTGKCGWCLEPLFACKC